MTRDRDIAAFDVRAPGYEDGWLGRLHHQIADRTADLALTLRPAPRRILDVGCGTGYLLRQLAARCPQAELAGIDPAPAMIEAARAAAVGERLQLVAGTAEDLPWPAGTFDLARQHHLLRSLGRSAGRPGAVRPGPDPRRVARALRPVLRLAVAHLARQPPRPGSHQAARYPAADRRGIPADPVARPVRRDHPRRRGSRTLGANVTTNLVEAAECHPARHGFAVPDNPTYDAAADARHWAALHQLYQAHQ